MSISIDSPILDELYEDKYVVIKKAKLFSAWKTVTDKDPNNLNAQIEYAEFEKLLKDIMNQIGHDYFVMNLDDAIALKLAEAYLVARGAQ
jgi:hypothetical protein